MLRCGLQQGHCCTAHLSLFLATGWLSQNLYTWTDLQKWMGLHEWKGIVLWLNSVARQKSVEVLPFTLIKFYSTLHQPEYLEKWRTTVPSLKKKKENECFFFFNNIFFFLTKSSIFSSSSSAVEESKSYIVVFDVIVIQSNLQFLNNC